MFRPLAASRNDLDIRFSRPDAYFAAIQADAAMLPVVARRTPVSCCRLLLGSQRSETRSPAGRMRSAACRANGERLAQLSAARSPPRVLHALWHDLCFNQFHDTLGGSSIKDAEDEAVASLGGDHERRNEIVDDAGRAIAAQSTPRDRARFRGLQSVRPSRGPVCRVRTVDRLASLADGNWGLTDEEKAPFPTRLIETHEAFSSPRSSLNRFVFPVSCPPWATRLSLRAESSPGAMRRPAEPLTLENRPIYDVTLRPGDRRHCFVHRQVHRRIW